MTIKKGSDPTDTSTYNPLYVNIKPLEVNSLTTSDEDNPGTLDLLLTKVDEELVSQINSLTMSESERGQIFSQTIAALVGGAIQYDLGKTSSYWNAVTAQMQARRAEIQNETAEQEFKIAELRVGTETAQKALIEAQTTQATEQTNLIKAQKALVDKQTENATLEGKVLTAQAEAFEKDDAIKLMRIALDMQAVLISNGSDTRYSALAEPIMNRLVLQAFKDGWKQTLVSTTGQPISPVDGT